MSKKKLALVFILMLLGVGGVFLWQKNQKDVAELNKNLPDGIRVVKNLQGEYWVVNKLDGYEFKIPEKWSGIEEIEYVPERTEENYTWNSINLEGKEGFGRVAGINRFKLQRDSTNLERWARNSLSFSGLESDLFIDQINEFEIIKTGKQIGIVGYIYFFQKDLSVYTVSCGSGEFIQEIISSGKW